MVASREEKRASTSSRHDKEVRACLTILEENRAQFEPLLQEMQRIFQTPIITPRNVQLLIECAQKMRELSQRYLGKKFSPDSMAHMYSASRRFFPEIEINFDFDSACAWRGITLHIHKTCDQAVDDCHNQRLADQLNMLKVLSNDLRSFRKLFTNEEILIEGNSELQGKRRRLQTVSHNRLSLKLKHKKSSGTDTSIEKKLQAAWTEQQTLEADIHKISYNVSKKHAHALTFAENVCAHYLRCDRALRLRHDRELYSQFDRALHLQLDRLVYWLSQHPYSTQAVVGGASCVLSQAHRALKTLKSELQSSLDPIRLMESVQNIINKNGLTQEVEQAGFDFTSLEKITEIESARQFDKELGEQCKKRYPNSIANQKQYYLQQIHSIDPTLREGLIDYLKQVRDAHLLTINTNRFTRFFGTEFNPNSTSYLMAIRELKSELKSESPTPRHSALIVN